MPITAKVEPGTGNLRITLWGTFTAEEIIKAVEGAAADPRFRPGGGVISDHRGVETPITPQQLVVFVEYLKSRKSQFRFSRCGIVVSTMVSHGMSRMFSVLALSIPVEVRVFMDMEGAERWVPGDGRHAEETMKAGRGTTN